ncbi:MAG: phage head protein [Cyanobacteria bacterium J149]|nr:MAG: phage head protein [Cyanobacteria bacterium J149]
MAQASAIKTYDAVGNREDLTNLVVMVSPEKTPLWSGVNKKNAKGSYHEWQTDSLANAQQNAQIEGADYQFSLPSARTRVGNYCQIFTKTLEVSGTQQAVDVAGVENEFKYQMGKRMKELATDIELALFTGTGNSGASGTAREMKGLFSFITTNVESGTGSGTEALTEDMFNDALQTAYESGAMPDTAYVNAFQKRQISTFSTSNIRYLDMNNEGRLRNYVGVYESDFGVIDIKLDQFCDTDKVVIVDSSLVNVAILRGIHSEDVAHIGDSKRGALVGELTLELGNEKGCAKIVDLTTS